MSEDVYHGFQKPASGNSDASALEFVVTQVLGRVWTSALVQVKSVKNSGVGPVGFVDVLPMVSQINGRGEATPHGIIHNLPYMRLQGGARAVIIDPMVNDIGLAIFASRDISTVKSSKTPNVPGSFRRFDPADGLYLGGFLNVEPDTYIRLTGGTVDLAADVSKTTGNFSVETGATGSFTTPMGQTVTVRDGIITNIY